MLHYEMFLYRDLYKKYFKNVTELKFPMKASLFLLVELQEVTLGSKVIVACTHICNAQLRTPAVQTLQVVGCLSIDCSANEINERS